MKLKLSKLLCVTILIYSNLINAQSVNLSVSPDNCMAPAPNSGSYTQSGTMNGKPMYVNGGNLRIIWTGSQWEVQGDDPAIGGVSWVTGWFNLRNTATPPDSCWSASFGCSIPTFSGNVTTIPNYVSSSITNVNTGANTITYTINFSGTISGLTTSNFSLTQNGVTGATINSVTAGAGNSWNVIVNYGTGNGNVVLNLANETGVTPGIGCTFALINLGTFYTTSNPVTLAAGDIAFTGYNSNTTDDFSFIVLKSGGIPIGTKIFFTDNGFNNIISQLNSAEGIMTWEATSAVPQFTQVKISIVGTTYTPTTGTCTSNSTGAVSFSSAGDQIIAFQGLHAQPTFITAAHFNSDGTGVATQTNLTTWDDFNNGTSSNRSALPTGLTSGTNAIIMVGGTVAPFIEYDNGVYNCSGTPNTDANALRLLINNRDNWTKQDATNLTTPPNCTFLSNDNFELNKLVIYPNPSSNFINIKMDEINFSQSIIKLFDLNGRMILNESMEEYSKQIDISKLQTGIYLLEISNNNFKQIKHIIKN